MISINKIKVESLIKAFESEIDIHHKEALNNLKNLLAKNRYLKSKESSYLRLIIREFQKNNFVSCPLKDMETLIDKIRVVPAKRKIKFAGKSKPSYLKDEILNALDYKGKRSSFYPKYFQSLGIKSCIYCNSQLTITIQKIKNPIEYKAKFQVDHYYPKDKYPYLSIALFNLYPTCASCNLAKSNNPFDFKLYDNKINTNLYQFKLNKKSKAKFLITRDIEDLEIVFTKIGNPQYEDIFNVNEIYHTQKDLAEEIILKALAYNETYREDLKDIYRNYRINDELINRLILGNYSNPEDIHKRPMAKFMQDIGKEVGLI
nr:hypothetical protein [uncultured Psychroserpens sp.]